MCMCLCVYVCMCVCVYVCLCVCMYVRMYVCMYVCMYVAISSVKNFISMYTLHNKSSSPSLANQLQVMNIRTMKAVGSNNISLKFYKI